MLALLHSLGGCGGTLVAQCLGNMPGAVLLSETNPRSAALFDGLMNPYVQLQQWYPTLFAGLRGEFGAKEMSESREFGRLVKRLCAVADAAGMHPILRDYNYIDYFGVPYADEPALDASLLQALHGRVRYRSAILIRHPLHQFASLRSHRAGRALTSSVFIRGYEAFLDDFSAAYVLKYENLVSAPLGAIALLCKYYGIPFAAAAVTHHHEYRLVTGQLARIGEAEISPSNRPHVRDAAIAEFETSPGYEPLLKRLGYGIVATV